MVVSSWHKDWYFGKAERYKIGEIVHCFYTEVNGACEVIGYEMRETSTSWFKTVRVRNLDTKREVVLNQGWIGVLLDRIC